VKNAVMLNGRRASSRRNADECEPSLQRQGEDGSLLSGVERFGVALDSNAPKNRKYDSSASRLTTAR